MSEEFWDEQIKELKFKSFSSQYRTYGWLAVVLIVLIFVFTAPFVIQKKLVSDTSDDQISSKIISAPTKEKVKGVSDKTGLYADFYRQVLENSKKVEPTPTFSILSPGASSLSSLATVESEQCFKDLSQALSFTKEAYNLAINAENDRFEKENNGSAPTSSANESHRQNLMKILSDYERTIVLVKSQYNCSGSSGDQVIN